MKSNSTQETKTSEPNKLKEKNSFEAEMHTTKFAGKGSFLQQKSHTHNHQWRNFEEQNQQIHNEFDAPASFWSKKKLT